MTKRSFAVFAVLALVALVISAEPSPDRAVASHAGGMDSLSLDLDPANTPGNTDSILGTRQPCARINENGILDADEDVVDGIFIDVTALGIPPFNNNGTPGNPADDSGGIISFSYTFNYSAQNLTVQALDNNGLLYRNPGSIPGDGSDPRPDDNADNVWNGGDLDTVDPNPESGSGYLHRLTLTSEAIAVTGVYPLTLTGAVHADAGNNVYAPDTIFDANVGINTNAPCGPPDFDGDGIADFMDNCPSVFNPSQTNSDSDPLGDACDNCPATANTDQANADADSLGDACDAGDSDGDLISDMNEYFCGAPANDGAKRPERVDLAGDDDGDTMVDEALPGGSANSDCDGDGYQGSTETHVFSASVMRDQDACGNNGWPADLASAGTSANRITLTDLSSFIAPLPRKLNTDPGDPGYDVRWDLVPGNGAALPEDIILTDLSNITLLVPPMLGGVKAFSGPVCPWPP